MTNPNHRILFVCVHNSARSQMAQAFLNKVGAGHFQAESAGLEPGKLNPHVVGVMKEIGLDISANKTQSVFDLFRQGRQYDAVITVCSGAETCPVFPGAVKRIGWSFDDPSGFSGTTDEVLKKTRQVRDEIEKKITEFVNEAGSVSYWIK